MTDKIGRNDSCPCGSGKKYKKCCGKTNLVEFANQVVVQEIEQYFQSLVTEMIDHFAIYTSEPNSDMESMDHMMKFLYWSIYDSDVMNQFVDRMAPSINREITRETVLSWKESYASIFRVESKPSEERLEISDTYTGQTYWISSNTIITDDNQSAPFLMGVLMRWGVITKLSL